MLTLKLALRSLARRKGRMALIGGLVAFGTFLIVFGTIFATSASRASRESIIRNFTGDFIVYSCDLEYLAGFVAGCTHRHGNSNCGTLRRIHPRMVGNRKQQ